jgi:hypothetical protein
MKKIKIFLILVVIFQLGACAQNLSLVKTERVNINDLYSVRPNINFNQLADSKITVWTVNGFSLDRIVFINNIKDGETLFGDDTTNTYKKDMNEVEIAELFIESMKVFGKWADGKFENLKLGKHGPYNGFKFEKTLINQDGLSYKGLTSGAVINEKLYLVFFIATELHFFNNLQNEFLNIISSMQKV